MSNPHGTPIWFELMTSDPGAAQAFYEQVLGWSVGGFGGATLDGSNDYRVLTALDGSGVGGMMKAPDGCPPGWLIYVGVDDVDDAVARIEAAGGSVQMPAMSLEGVGRMALVTDPGGASFYVMRGSSPESSTAFKRMAHGHGEWIELLAPDDQAALGFYESQFGWKKDGAMPMGEMGDYSFISHDGGVIGAVMRAPAGERPRWNVYFRTGQIDEAKARIEEAGGTLVHGPAEVPGGDFIIVAKDRDGAVFGLVGNR